MTREQEKMVSWYKQYLDNQDKTRLDQVFGRYSDEKAKAFERIRNRYIELYGLEFHLRIINRGGSWTFTTGSICTLKDGRKLFKVETKGGTHMCGYSNGDLYDLRTGEIFYEA